MAENALSIFSLAVRLAPSPRASRGASARGESPRHVALATARTGSARQPLRLGRCVSLTALQSQLLREAALSRVSGPVCLLAVNW